MTRRPARPHLVSYPYPDLNPGISVLGWQTLVLYQRGVQVKDRGCLIQITQSPDARTWNVLALEVVGKGLTTKGKTVGDIEQALAGHAHDVLAVRLELGAALTLGGEYLSAWKAARQAGDMTTPIPCPCGPIDQPPGLSDVMMLRDIGRKRAGSKFIVKFTRDGLARLAELRKRGLVAGNARSCRLTKAGRDLVATRSVETAEGGLRGGAR